ncbi:polysaccharide biosynthesis/export family protein [Dyadobacter fanqingshengii]|uniref:Polysaccharide biosynthesis/export family protein n=1 Tax=Dyadobacter fanqingshengii TaxID=2906443 RepID=A0A9X1PE86_9BACT|nr:polysaccharide biosynthesis/export family protein [Dyadobacter fanqingshengii]MCF0042524.1 polysaccharide biosynthesis/export family protein [Dyadobacter fanqingshengii]USJ36248.1 polysaccharide biosynthesis/export family protein [Dyadobacter fanqingshengii]
MILTYKTFKKSIPAAMLVICFFAIILTNSSCVSPKSIVYFQGDSAAFSSQEITQKYIPMIQPSDILSIIVGSLNAEANEVFNAPNTFTTASTNYSNVGGPRVQPLGYLVDVDGNIEVPLVGKMHVAGMRTTDAADTIRARLVNYLKEPSVIVRNLNFKVSVLGEVKLPAVYVIPDEKISLPEVLSLAGDLTIYGNRNNVMIIREEQGKRQYARIDLTSRDIFNSPYYYIHKNDVIYVEPVKARMLDTDSRIRTVPLVVTIVGGISTVGILILNLVRL